MEKRRRRTIVKIGVGDMVDKKEVLNGIGGGRGYDESVNEETHHDNIVYVNILMYVYIGVNF